MYLGIFFIFAENYNIMKKIYALLFSILFAHTMFGQIYLNIDEMPLDSCKSCFVKPSTQSNSQFLPSFYSDARTAKGSIILDSVKYYYPVDYLTTLLYMGVMHYNNYGSRDSIIWYDLDPLYNYRSPSEKIEYNYSSSGKLSSRYTYGYAGSTSGGVWIKAKGDEYYYDQNDSIIQRKIYTYDSGYRLKYNMNYQYDSLGNLFEIKEQYWNYSHPIDNYYIKKEATYNQNNQILCDTLFQMTNSGWYATEAENRTYDSLNKLKTVTPSIILADSSWYQWNMLEYSINQANLVDTILKFRKSNLGGWYLAQKFFYSYTPTNNLSSAKAVDVIAGVPDLPYFKQDRFYTIQDLSKINEYKYDTITQSWIIDKIWEAVYDSLGNVIYDYNCYVNFYTGLWDSIVNEKSFFNESINASGSDFPFFQNPSMVITEYVNPNSNNLLMERMLYKKGTFDDSIVMRGHMTFYYSGIPSGFSEFSEESSYKIYPNPASTQVTVSIPGFEKEGNLILYDISGRLVRSYLIKNRQTLSVEGLSNGIYLYSIITNNKYFTGKLCINH